MAAPNNSERKLWVRATRIGGMAGFVALFTLAAIGIDVPQQLYFLTAGLLFGKEIVAGRIRIKADEDDDDAA